MSLRPWSLTAGERTHRRAPRVPQGSICLAVRLRMPNLLLTAPLAAQAIRDLLTDPRADHNTPRPSQTGTTGQGHLSHLTGHTGSPAQANTVDLSPCLHSFLRDSPQAATDQGGRCGLMARVHALTE